MNKETFYEFVRMMTSITIGFLILIGLAKTVSTVNDKEVSIERYEQVRQWKKEYPELKSFIQEKLLDDKITVNEYYDVEEQVESLKDQEDKKAIENIIKQLRY